MESKPHDFVRGDAMPEVRTELQVYGSKRPYVLIVEPWADQFVINPGEQCKIVAVHDSESASFGIEHHPECVVVYVNRGGDEFEFWRGDTRER